MLEKQITNRIRAVVNCVEQAEVVADIGCDHGYVAALLLIENRARRVIACDISGPSLQKARELSESIGLGDQFECRLGDGLATLNPQEADVAVIAGVGGQLICDMLRREPQTAKALKRLVLAPNRNEAELRQYLVENGFCINAEALAYDNGRYYSVSCVEPGCGRREEDAFYYEVGRKLIESGHPLLEGYLRNKINQKKVILQAVGDGSETNKEYIGEIKRRIGLMGEVVNHGKCNGTGTAD